MMVYADYYHCDVCDAKAFYDANLNWDVDCETDEWKLERVGEMKVLCDDCAKTHEVVICSKATIAQAQADAERLAEIEATLPHEIHTLRMLGGATANTVADRLQRILDGGEKG